MKRGYEFCSETDTEVLVKLLDPNYHGEPLDAILRTLEPVSYTHLDVYKRQEWCGAARPFPPARSAHRPRPRRN